MLYVNIDDYILIDNLEKMFIEYELHNEEEINDLFPELIVVVDGKTMFITAKLLDVETARTIMTDNMMMGTTADAIQKGCIALAKKMFHDENTNSAVETEKKTLFQM